MCTKWFSDGDVHQYFTPYGTPYEAFLNYMNVLADFEIRVKEYAANKGDAQNKNEVQTAPAEVSLVGSDDKVPTPKATKTKSKPGLETVKKTVTKAKK
jgi:alpha-amylase